MTSARSTSVRWAAGVTVSLLALTACGGTDDGATPTTSTTPSATTQTPEPSATPTLSPTEMTPPPSTVPPPTSAPPTSEVPSAKPIKVKVTITAGQVTSSVDTVEVTAGDTVTLTVKTDTADSIHVHGVDQEYPLTANAKNSVTFEIPADLAPGQYEVETHENPLLLFMLQVS